LETNALTIGVGHSDAVLAVASCQDEKSNFISCGKDQTVSYWKLTTVDDKNVKLELVSFDIV
jgi:WD40 repeat protein